MVALGEELHGLGGAQRRAQQPLAVCVLAEFAKDAAVGGLDRRQTGLVLRLLAGRVVVALQRGLLGVDDEPGEGAAALELFHCVVDHPVHGCVESGGGGGSEASEISVALLIFLSLSFAVFKPCRHVRHLAFVLRWGLFPMGRERGKERENTPPTTTFHIHRPYCPPPNRTSRYRIFCITSLDSSVSSFRLHPFYLYILDTAAASILSLSAADHTQLSGLMTARGDDFAPPPTNPGLLPSCVEFACSPCVRKGSVRFLQLPPTIQKYSCEMNFRTLNCLEGCLSGQTVKSLFILFYFV